MDRKLNPIEVEKLPITVVKIGNETKRIRYDPETNIIYRLNEDDTWDGSIVKRDWDDLDKLIQKDDEIEPGELVSKDESPAECLPTEKTQMPPESSDGAPVALGPQAVSDEPDNRNEYQVNSEKDAAEDIKIKTHEVPGEDAQDKQSEEPESEQPKKKSPLKAALFPVLCVVLFVLIGLSLWGSVRDKMPQKSETATSATNASAVQNETIASAADETSQEDTQSTAPEATHIQVLVPNTTLIPGQELTADIIDHIDISKEEYQQLSTAAGIYTAEELVSLEGLVAQNYVPAGRYLTYDDIGRSYSPVNPWAPDLRDVTTVMLPITPTEENLQDFIWGNRIDLTITIQTKQTNTNDKSTDDAKTDGLEHESSVVESMVIDTYRLQGVQITDILDADQQSLYTRYTAISAVPSALQVSYLKTAYSDATVFQADIPSYIIIAVTQAQADVIEALDVEAMAITVSNPVAENTTSLQYDTYLKIQEATSSIAAAWPQLTEEGATE